MWCVENLGSQRTIERVLLDAARHEAVIEWTHWKRDSGTAQRGDERYVFEPVGANGQGLIREIRAYYAAPAAQDLQALPRSAEGVAMGELVDFDYGRRGYHLNWDQRGVFQADGFALELPAISLSESLVKPTTMLYRNFLAMEAEELLRSHPVDAAVLMGGWPA